MNTLDNFHFAKDDLDNMDILSNGDIDMTMSNKDGNADDYFASLIISCRLKDLSFEYCVSPTRDPQDDREYDIPFESPDLNNIISI